MPQTQITTPRLHVGLEVRDLDRSRAFYATLLGVSPSKQREGYAKFESREPSVNLSLTANPGSRPAAIAGAAHFGIEVPSTGAVREAASRLAGAGYEARPEDRVTCCYAVQDKVWTTDPDGNRWEVYVYLQDAETFGEAAGGEERTCCSPSCCA